jgi:hypothetical protein
MNIYNRLLGLLPVSKTEVGTVTITYTDGCQVELQTGGFKRVKGAATVGQRVFIKDNQVISTAPTLSGVEIDI